MIEFIELLRIFIFDHRSLEYIIIFVGVIIGGEFALFTLGFFIAQGILSAFSVVVLSFFASFLPNILWFLLAKTATIEKIISYRYTNTTISIITQAITRASRGNHFIGLIFIKFLIGTPVILTMYVNKTRLKFLNFLIYETPAIVLSLLILISIGFLSGLGFTYFADIFNNFYIAIGFLLLVIITIFAVQLWFKKKFTNADI
ncbi:MAG: hypothetical protein WC884_02430 [Candidatus Paceibacterota bacterium]